jgi:hypothetical protein
MKQNKMFEVIQHDDAFHEDLQCIHITEGDFEGVVFQYDNIRLEEDSDDPTISFNFITVKNENNLDLTSDEFVSILGEILNDLLRSFVDANRTDGTETPSE